MRGAGSRGATAIFNLSTRPRFLDRACKAGKRVVQLKGSRSRCAANSAKNDGKGCRGCDLDDRGRSRSRYRDLLEPRGMGV